MTYNKDSHIKSVEDVKAFFNHLVDERKLNFHPDDDFADYISYEDKTPSFTKEEVSVYIPFGLVGLDTILIYTGRTSLIPHRSGDNTI